MAKSKTHKQAHAVCSALKDFLEANFKIGLTLNKETGNITLDRFEQFVKLKAALMEYEGLETEKADAPITEETSE